MPDMLPALEVGAIADDTVNFHEILSRVSHANQHKRITVKPIMKCFVKVGTLTKLSNFGCYLFGLAVPNPEVETI